MENWQLLAVIGIGFLLVELFTPLLFFLNFAVACFFTAIIAFFVFDWNILIPITVVVSIVLLKFVRPILMRSRNGNKKTGIQEKYIGKIAKVIEPVSVTKGTVAIYDERWSARVEVDEEIQIGEEVKIIKNDGLIFYVEKHKN